MIEFILYVLSALIIMFLAFVIVFNFFIDGGFSKKHNEDFCYKWDDNIKEIRVGEEEEIDDEVDGIGKYLGVGRLTEEEEDIINKARDLKDQVERLKKEIAEINEENRIKDITINKLEESFERLTLKDIFKAE